MKPMIVLPPGQMSQSDIKTLRDNGLCVVVAKDPNRVRFVDPIPASSSRTQIENAAIQLSRKVLNPFTWRNPDDVAMYTRMFVEILLEGTPLSSKPTQEEKESEAYRIERIETVRRMAREDAKREKEERDKAKAKDEQDKKAA